MRIFTILLLLIFCIKTSEGQTIDQKDNKSVKIKTYNLPPSSDFNTWDIGGNLGLTYPYTDISASGKRNFAIAIDVTKFLTHTFALQTRFMHASLSGIDVNKPQYRFNTTINYDITLNGIVQIGNILKHNRDLAIYASFGFGLIHYSPNVFTDGGIVVQTGIYSQYSQPLVIMDYQSTTNLLIPIGVGVKYRLSKNYSITGEYSFRTTNSDKLDGFYKLLSAEDNYSFFSVGITYHIGKQLKVLEWVNPLQVIYDDLNDMKDKIDLLSKDTDMDGVPDLYDREPNTPPGIKVYGDGTSVDINVFVDVPVKRIEKDDKANNTVNVPGTEIVKDTNTYKKNIEKVEEVTTPSVSVRSASPVNPDTLSKLNPDDTSLYENYKDLPSVFFESGENKISAKHFKTLEYIALVMKNNPEINFTISGICDNSGSLQYNLTLSKRRAESVKRYLERNYNINPNRLSINTIGTYDSVKGNSQMNRRVDIKVRN